MSRGDKSGTHAAELRYWKDAGVDLEAKKGPLVSRHRVRHGTDAQHRVRDERLRIDRPRHLARHSRIAATSRSWSKGDKKLFNQYGVMLVNPAKHPHVKRAMGQQFIDWLVSPRGQTAIADYKIGGEQLFSPTPTDRGSFMESQRQPLNATRPVSVMS